MVGGFAHPDSAFRPLCSDCGGSPHMHGTSSDHRLAAHEAEALWRAWSVNHDKSARDRLVLAYSPMVNYLASRKLRELPPPCELDNLVAYGLVALIDAYDPFNPAKVAPF